MGEICDVVFDGVNFDEVLLWYFDVFNGLIVFMVCVGLEGVFFEDVFEWVVVFFCK